MQETDYTTVVRGGAKYERHMYYRRPDRGEHRSWIVVGGTNEGRRRMFGIRGFQPLDKYGVISNGETNCWQQILSHPDGPSEFPVEQVLTLRWYKDPPVPGVMFPQLAGHRITEYKCPECERPAFTGIEHLGRHLRIIHSWDRASLVKYGERVGIDFDAIYSAVKETFEFKLEEPSPYACAECDWKPKAAAKNPAQALRMHERGHELQVETVG